MILITKDIVDQLRHKGKYTFTAQIENNIDAKVFLTRKEDDEVFVRAYLMTRTPNERIDEVSEATCTVRSMDMLHIDIRDLCNKLIKKLRDFRTPPVLSSKRSMKDFAERVYAVPNVLLPESYKKYVPRGWTSKSTVAKAVSYYANTIGTKVYGVYGYDATIDDFMVFLEQECDTIYDRQYAHPTKDGRIIKQRREGVYNGIAKRFDMARAVQMFLLEHAPEGEWPSMPIPTLPRYVAASAEEIKSIHYEHYIKLCTLLKRLCEMEYPLAFNALGEVCNGERVGESCAHLIGDFELQEDFGRVYIDYQLDEDGNRTTILKNEYSHRFTFFGGFLREMVLLRTTQLASRGYSESEYALMPFGAYADTPYTFIDKKKVSSFIRKLLKLVGCDEKWLEAEAEKMFVAAKAVGNSEDLDTPAHLLRRTIATFFSNGGMPLDYVDAVLGHANEENLKKDFASWDKAKEIAAMAERSIWLGSLCSTKNPAYTPVPLCGNRDFLLDGNSRYCFRAEEDTYIEIDITALDGDAGLHVIVPDTYRTTSFQLRNPADTTTSRSVRTIPPKLPDKEEVEHWIREAEEIDLSMFEGKE